MNYTLSALHFKKVENVRNANSFHIKLLPCYASHCLKQVYYVALHVIIFRLRIVACYVRVRFLNACYVGFGPVFFCTYEEYELLINLWSASQGHQQFNVLATPCDVHAHRKGPVRQCACALSCAWTLSRVHPFARGPVFLRFQRARSCAAVFDRARGPGRPADPDAAQKTISKNGTAGR